MPKQVLTTEKIIAGAVAQIEAGTTLTFSTLAKSLGSRSQAIYTYFPNVQALQYAVVTWAVQTARQQVQNETFGQSGMAAIISFTLAFRQLALRHDRLARFVLTQDRTQDNPDVVAAFDQVRELLHQLVDGVFQDKDIRTLVSRDLRDTTVGDIINVSAGWFAGGTMPADDSFEKIIRQHLDLFKSLDQQATK